MIKAQPLQLATSFRAQLEQRWQRGNFVCVGLDPEYERLPVSVKEGRTPEEALYFFAREIIDATHDLACAYKPNSAFYEALGVAGMRALERIVAYCKEHYPEIPVILDAKRADIGNTNHGYITAAFDLMHVDAITVHPYLGKEALTPFLNRKDKGVIVLAKTSNPGSGELQNLLVGEAQEPLYLLVARNVAQHWNEHGNCALVVGATYPEELRRVREVVGDVPLLIPGIGAQGGDVAATVQAGKDSRGWGMIINSSRGIIYASSGADFAQAARKATEALHLEINSHRA
ncbi:orotidine-5'-phosphate decarboxylase [Dictyobacter arantiisoli]|uniref:Orotidine 5'-phosphate decarboxylase n=1 Tax=Dictyobacter arantiisoli TaxID=2014874 RepID=A0A5A5T810_9CHLR|nr:orotidine-5'-phosphate decarboxylase [Dictyobacter arantiisoli]GCF07405.1 orotidine 5'-phosphate decarboxylase [Dictyobacter arantiisoli]